MKLLLDECLPGKLMRLLAGHSVAAVPEVIGTDERSRPSSMLCRIYFQ